MFCCTASFTALSPVRALVQVYGVKTDGCEEADSMENGLMSSQELTQPDPAYPTPSHPTSSHPILSFVQPILPCSNPSHPIPAHVSSNTVLKLYKDGHADGQWSKLRHFVSRPARMHAQICPEAALMPSVSRTTLQVLADWPSSIMRSALLAFQIWIGRLTGISGSCLKVL